MDTLNQHERWEYKIGAPIETVDGPVGPMRQVILNPDDGRVTALVVRRLSLSVRDLFTPVEEVETSSDAAIQLKLTKA